VATRIAVAGGSHTSSTEDVMLVARVGGWAGVAARMRIGAVAARNPGSGILLAVMSLGAGDCCIAVSHSCGLKWCLNTQKAGAVSSHIICGGHSSSDVMVAIGGWTGGGSKNRSNSRSCGCGSKNS